MRREHVSPALDAGSLHVCVRVRALAGSLGGGAKEREERIDCRESKRELYDTRKWDPEWKGATSSADRDFFFESNDRPSY